MPTILPFLIKKTRERFFDILVFSFFFFLPLGTKKFLFSLKGPAITSEFDGVFLFINDIWIFIFVIVIFFFFKQSGAFRFLKNKFLIIPLLFFLFFAFLSIFVSSHLSLSVYAFIRLFLGIILGACVAEVVRRSSIILVASGLFAAGILQSCFGIIQFILGKSIGIRYLGEVVVNETTHFVARTVVGNALFLRAYGTMQHANILAAFLVAAFLSGLFLLVSYFVREKQKNLEFISIISGLFIIACGITVTFSRSGWIALSSALTVFLVSFFLTKKRREIAIKTIFLLCLFFISIFLLFGWAILPRASFDAREPSVALRVDYLQLGSAMIKDHLFTGVGIGNETDYAKDHGLYNAFGIIRSQDYQPIHNIPILVFSEVGIFGSISLGIFFLFLFLFTLRNIKTNDAVVWVFSVLFGFFVFSLVDHFFWTTQSGISLLWVFIFLLLVLFYERVKVSTSPRS